MKIISDTVLLSTPFLEMVVVSYVDHVGQSRKWYGVRRVRSIPAVSIAAVTKAGEVIFVQQNRPMAGGPTIELPAGLMDIEGESVLETAQRELLEETGYDGNSFTQIVGGTRGLIASAGLTDERHYLVYTSGVQKVAEPYLNEGTKPILVPLTEAYAWLESMVAAGHNVDYSLFGNVRILESLEGASHEPDSLH